jgi:hypothetical protein
MHGQLKCPVCGAEDLHLLEMEQADDAHPNKIDLIFRCEQCKDPVRYRVWGHEGKMSRTLYAATTVRDTKEA